MKFWNTLWKRIHQDHTESSSTRIPLDRAAVPLVQTLTGRMIGMLSIDDVIGVLAGALKKVSTLCRRQPGQEGRRQAAWKSRPTEVQVTCQCQSDGGGNKDCAG
jgi:hypothetical protein